MTPNEWNKALAPNVPAEIASAAVAGIVRATLDGSALFLSTTELADLLYSPHDMRGDEGMAARKRLFGCLRWLATHSLVAYATPGGPVIRTRFGKRRAERPLVWHAPVAERQPRKCPNCGATLEG